LLNATNITKSYKNHKVLDSISLTASAGESVVIIGRNGEGKSTFLSILAGYLRADSGTVELGGHGVAFCPQHDNLFEELSVRDNLLFWARAKGSSLEPESMDYSTLLGVNEYLNKKVRNLSGGMKKCVAILCALSGGADVLILDEPFSGLDIVYKDVLLTAFDELKAMGKCIIYTSHNIDEITGLDSRIYALSGGKLNPVHSTEKDSDYNLLRASFLEHSKS
jgi:ABC-type multidrug transport system ATPase subunit